MERYVARARHIEVQILAELASAPNLSDDLRDQICAAAIRVAQTTGYINAGTVEFLVDADAGEWFFIEANPRIQVEHTVTEMVTGIDLVRSQILVAQGCRLHEAPLSIPPQSEIPRRGTAMQCRITTEDPANEFSPDYGRLQTYRSPRGDGSRLDGTAYAGAVLSPFYDSLLVKLTAWDSEPFRRLHPGRPGSAGVPDPGGRDQHPVPAQCDQPPGFPERSGDHPLPGREARTLRDTVAS